VFCRSDMPASASTHPCSALGVFSNPQQLCTWFPKAASLGAILVLFRSLSRLTVWAFKTRLCHSCMLGGSTPSPCSPGCQPASAGDSNTTALPPRHPSDGRLPPPCSVTVHADKQRADDPDVKDAFQTRADYCLMATGRKPNTHNLGLQEVRTCLCMKSQPA
jgi:hypothetical protein